MKSLTWCAFLVTLVGCAVPIREAKLPPDSVGYVAVLSGEMPGALSQVARHAWIVANVPGSQHQQWRFELQQSGSDPFDYFGDGDVAIHAIIRYEPEELDSVVHCLDRAETRYHHEHPDYFPIPGPNSNTIVDLMLRACDIHVELPATAIGRDYRGPIGASVTSVGTGVQVESWVVGAKIGLEEGVEVHLLDLALGVHLWPPGLTVPVNPGRIGIEDSAHRAAEDNRRRQRRMHRRREWEREEAREYGLVSLFMDSHYARLVDPESARGLTDLANVGLEGWGGYGSTFGYGIGFDLDAGLGLPLGFGYATRLYPLGFTWMLGNNSFLGAFTGIGASGVSGHVAGAFELPAELRLELDIGPTARFGASAHTTLFSGADSRRGDGLFEDLDDELVLSTFVRVGAPAPCSCRAQMGRGYFLGLERGRLLGSSFVGLKFGIQADFGG
jgi:hypothetical protein